MKIDEPVLNPVLRGYMKDLATLQLEFVAAVEVQIRSDQVKELGLEALDLKNYADESSALLRENVQQLQVNLSGAYQDGAVETPIGGVAGAVRTVVRAAREIGSQHPVVAMVEDLHGLLSRVMVKYEILHAAALSGNASMLAKMALRHLEIIHLLLRKLTEVIPKIAVLGISKSEQGFSSKVADPAANNIQETIE